MHDNFIALYNKQVLCNNANYTKWAWCFSVQKDEVFFDATTNNFLYTLEGGSTLVPLVGY